MCFFTLYRFMWPCVYVVAFMSWHPRDTRLSRTRCQKRTRVAGIRLAEQAGGARRKARAEAARPSSARCLPTNGVSAPTPRGQRAVQSSRRLLCVCESLRPSFQGSQGRGPELSQTHINAVAARTRSRLSLLKLLSVGSQNTSLRWWGDSHKQGEGHLMDWGCLFLEGHPLRAWLLRSGT